ncbi:MAG: 4-hydroxy-tetrahydrodipicolinate synthase [Firmicutes bacterium]|nr:4-hydroxy-tetrahydrodipicolinate synthase [Bacillota bacterium]
MNTIFKGSCVASITPFDENGKIDYKAYGKLIEFQIACKTSAFLTLGTTGEPSVLSDEEKRELIKFVVNKVNKRIKVIVGTGGNNTEKVIADSLYAQNCGADALLIVTPYYNKCTQNGLIAHYTKIADAVNIPIIVYNVPSRTGLNMLPKTFSKMAEHKNIVGIKEACGNFEQICELLSLVGDKAAVYSGDDALTFPMICLGAQGVISAAANILPLKVSELCSLTLNKKYDEAKKLHNKFFPLIKALFLEVSPIPIKAAAEQAGLCKNILRLPLTPIEPKNLEILKEKLNIFTKGD